ncbi:MAG: hypothetical protein E7544_00950 [Ruminococcaceae bacterium]|nr:hypothetical protein [Oscillospiraceae bacterium]
MKNFIAYLFASIILLMCGTESDGILNAMNIQEKDCSVIVFGQEVNTDGYAKIDYKILNAKIPLFKVMNEMGVYVEWINEHEILISYEGKNYNLDVSDPEFGIPLDGARQAREIIGNEIVIDVTAFNHILRYLGLGEMTVDFIRCCVYI